MRCISLGPLTIWRDPKLGGTYLDWRPYTDPRHWRVVVAFGPVWLPLGEREGWSPQSRCWRIGRFEIRRWGAVS